MNTSSYSPLTNFNNKKDSLSHSCSRTRSQLYPNTTTPSGYSPNNSAGANIPSYNPKPVSRTISLSSHLHLESGNSLADHDTEHFQPPSQGLVTSGTPTFSLNSSSLSSSSPSTSFSSSPHHKFSSSTSSNSASSSFPNTPYSRANNPSDIQHHQQKKQQKRAQQYTNRQMFRTEQGSNVQDTIATFSRLMNDDDDKASYKGPATLPLLTINTPLLPNPIPGPVLCPPSLSPSSDRSTLSTSSEACSPATPWAISPTLPSAALAINIGSKEPLILLSEPSTPMSAIPGSINGSLANTSGFLPLVGRDFMSYSSLNATLVTGKVAAESTPRPLSSMEYAESWLPTMIPNTTSTTETVGDKTCVTLVSTRSNNHTTSYNGSTDIDQTRSIKTVGRVSTDQQSIHPFQLDIDHDVDDVQDGDHSDKEPLSASASEDNSEKEPFSQHQKQPTIRKKTSLAAKIRNVFASKQGSSKGLETQEDIISLSSNDDDRVNSSIKSKSPSQGDQHRGSVSSTSSAETVPGHNESRRDLSQAITPITSPDSTPVSSPTIKTVPTLAQDSSDQQQVAIESSSEPQLPDQETEHSSGRESNTSSPTNEDSTISDSHSIIRLTPTRTVKKRLSFASISSFFGATRNPQERRQKQQRSSSLPHVENPLVAVGRQIAGFQRRHSFNDLEAKGQSNHQQVTPSWEKNGSLAHSITPITIPSSSASGQPTTPTKKLSLNVVFNKQLKKKKNASTRAAPLVPAKPLKSALVHRPPVSANGRVHHVHTTRRRSASVRSQNSSQRRSQHFRQTPNGHHHHHHHQHHHHHSQRQSSPQDDPFARLAEANQALASLSIKGSDSRKASISGNQDDEISPADEYCTSPQDYENSNGQSFSLERLPTNDGRSKAPSTPKVLPVTTKSSRDTKSDSYYSPPPNPLASLSRNSSCCSFTSSTEDANGSRSTSSLTESELSCDSSSCSRQFEVNLTAISNPYPRNLGVDQVATGASSNISDGTVTESAPVFNSLLPASAARVSVDQLAFESQMSHNNGSEALYGNQNNLSPTGNSCSTYKSSTLSNSSTTPSSTSSPGNNNDVKYTSCCQHGCIASKVGSQQADAASYQHLKHQQQLMALDQQHYDGAYYMEHQEDQEYYPESDSTYDNQYYYEDSTYPPRRPPRRLQFSEEPIIHHTFTPEQYDRTSDPNITASRLTPPIAQKIKSELNQFKSQEMEVHQDSRMYTHFFI